MSLSRTYLTNAESASGSETELAVVLDGMDLTDKQWTILALILPKPRLRPDGRGRPWRDPRDVLNGILSFFGKLLA